MTFKTKSFNFSMTYSLLDYLAMSCRRVRYKTKPHALRNILLNSAEVIFPLNLNRRPFSTGMMTWM